MRKGISILVLAAMLAQGPAALVAPVAEARTGPQGLCRGPAPLPQLGPEQDASQQRPRPRPAATAGAVPKDAAAEVTVTGSAAPVLADAPVAVTTASGPAVAPPAVLPPPPPPPAAGEAASRADAARPATSGYFPNPYPLPPRPQAGLLTAGEHDDLLNPELYADYVRRSDLGQAIPDLPLLDTDRVLTVAVKDAAGRPVPFAPVEVICADGNRLTFTTMADGTIALFPDLDRLGRDVRIRTGREETRRVTIARNRGGQRIEFTVDRAAAPARKLDLLLTIDTTGSMGDEIRFLQAELGSIIASVRARHPGLDLRVGFVFYRDLGDDYVTATVPFSSDIAAAEAQLRQRWAGGGGDYPEAMDQALIRAAGLDWRPDAVKTMLLVADAPPHDDKFALAWRAAEHLRASRVHIVPVAASGVADKAEYAMRAMAAATQSRYTFLTDDSGVGNPHAPPAIDCYLVTRLDALLRRVIDSQLSGRRVEPGEEEVIRRVGQYDRGRCVIPPGFGQQG